MTKFFDLKSRSQYFTARLEYFAGEMERRSREAIRAPNRVPAGSRCRRRGAWCSEVRSTAAVHVRSRADRQRPGWVPSRGVPDQNRTVTPDTHTLGRRKARPSLSRPTATAPPIPGNARRCPGRLGGHTPTAPRNGRILWAGAPQCVRTRGWPHSAAAIG
ncbi:hypothetical protein PVAP13_5NG127132 [Panicum virgatum]|uniref:Uncharacterized protein n=1 Tax=Panicum virgatum TaxID=38727 RepID=A0A8T0RMA1_PANVG|nr:hypothetical protein PVAP13_5NG127132 [Panicum virgatum]